MVVGGQDELSRAVTAELRRLGIAPPRGSLMAANHVEMKVAVLVRETDYRAVTLAVNNEPCARGPFSPRPAAALNTASRPDRYGVLAGRREDLHGRNRVAVGHHLEVAYHNDQAVTELHTAEDVDRLLIELGSCGPDHTAATVYAVDPDKHLDFPDHELTIGIDPARGVAALRYSGVDGTLYSQGNDSNPNGVNYTYFGNGHDFPADAEVPLTAARDAVAQLLATGGTRPDGMTWRDTGEVIGPFAIRSPSDGTAGRLASVQWGGQGREVGHRDRRVLQAVGVVQLPRLERILDRPPWSWRPEAPARAGRRVVVRRAF
ncbi:Imm1 family immunity protein [Actinosynnema sp. CS-041913]|uniref:Imm1 family immunity protein n=1 Tax=Actinosynnema sp. CS-041913 TaxID=3239917 RepID=UPI003D8C3C04